MANSPEQRPGSGTKGSTESPDGVTADEAERLAEQFTPLWEREPAETSGEPPAKPTPAQPGPSSPAKFVHKKTMLGMEAVKPPTSAAEPEPASARVEAPAPAQEEQPPEAPAPAQEEQPPEAPAPAQEEQPPEAPAPAQEEQPPEAPPKKADVPFGKKTMIGVAPPSSPDPPAKAASEVDSIDVDVDTTAEADPVAPEAAAPALVAPVLAAPSVDELEYKLPEKNRKIVFVVMAVAAAILLIVGIKAIMGSGAKTNDNTSTRGSNAIPAQPAKAKPPAKEQPAKAKPPAKEQPARAKPPAKVEPARAKPPAKRATVHRPAPVARKTAHHAAATPRSPPTRRKHTAPPKSGSGSIIRATPF